MDEQVPNGWKAALTQLVQDQYKTCVPQRQRELWSKLRQAQQDFGFQGLRFSSGLQHAVFELCAAEVVARIELVGEIVERTAEAVTPGPAPPDLPALLERLAAETTEEDFREVELIFHQEGLVERFGEPTSKLAQYRSEALGKVAAELRLLAVALDRRGATGIARETDRLKVFVSSVIPGMQAERQAAAQGIEDTGVARPWRFEAEPASAKSLEDSYLDPLRESDAVVQVIGCALTEPVSKEYQLARDLGKPFFLFVVAAGVRSADVAKFLRTVDVKYGEFGSPDQLRAQVRGAIHSHVIQSARHPPAGSSGLSGERSALLNLARQGSTIRVFPVVPPHCQSDPFRVRELRSDVVVLEKLSSQQQIIVPLVKVKCVYSAAGGFHVIEVDGRIQWTDPEERWQFFGQPPPEGDSFGLSKPATDAHPLLGCLREKGYGLGWKLEPDAKGEAGVTCDFVYDSDGKYLKRPGRQHELVLVRKRTSD